MMQREFAEALSVDTRGAVGRWWAHRHSTLRSLVPGGLVEDIQAARLQLDDRLQARLWEQHLLLSKSEQDKCAPELLGLDPWDVFFDLRERRAETMATATEAVEHEELIAALKERARRRERLVRPSFRSGSRRRVRDLARGRGGMRAVLNDDGACLMLRFGAARCGLVEVDVGVVPAPDATEVRAELGRLTADEARRAAEAVLNDPLVGRDDRGRPAEPEIKEFIRAVSDAVERHVGRQLTPTITQSSARSKGLRHVPGPDIQVILDLLTCHAPAKEAEAIADLIKSR